MRNSIRFKVSAYNPKTLNEAYGLAMNFEKEVNSRIERNKSQLEKRSLESIYPNQSSKIPNFLKTSKPSQFSKFN